ncbi:MFS transporter [Delftia sp. WSY_7]|uniref:MFS transporter n=1 Tax=Delftia sp. WSY_7 TaxID=3367202 RepID=UPI003709CB6C
MAIPEPNTSLPGERTPVTAPHGLALALLTLGLGGLFVGTGEFASMSLLPDMAKSTEVSVPAAGAYIGSYALGVVIGAPLLAVLGARLPRKTFLLLLLAFFAIGYGASAASWNYSSLLVSRFLAGLPHGAFYGVASLVAAAMVPENKKAQAIGYVMLGLAAANVVGVPAATWLGQAMGWRAAFVSVAVGSVVSAVLLVLLVPSTPTDSAASPMSELSGLRLPQVWLTLAVASIGFGGMFAVYSFITPTLTEVTGIKEATVPTFLALLGIGMVVGNLLGGWLADKALVPAIFLIMGWNFMVLGAFYFTASSPAWAIVNLFLIGVGFALVPALQTRLMNVAGSAQTLAAALNHSAFNISNAIGAALGGMAISHGFGWQSTAWVAAALALAGICVMTASVAIEKRSSLSGREPRGNCTRVRAAQQH